MSLKPLLLPQLVEERRKKESLADSEIDLAPSFCYSEKSAASEMPSPVTPTFSTRGHLRYPSSASSIDSTFHVSSTEIPSSPTFIGPKTGKRSLPDVQEEPHDQEELQQREEEFDILEEVDELYDCLCKSRSGVEWKQGLNIIANNAWDNRRRPAMRAS